MSSCLLSDFPGLAWTQNPPISASGLAGTTPVWHSAWPTITSEIEIEPYASKAGGIHNFSFLGGFKSWQLPKCRSAGGISEPHISELNQRPSQRQMLAWSFPLGTHFIYLFFFHYLLFKKTPFIHLPCEEGTAHLRRVRMLARVDFLLALCGFRVRFRWPAFRWPAL